MLGNLVGQMAAWRRTEPDVLCQLPVQSDNRPTSGSADERAADKGLRHGTFKCDQQRPL
jgi:hypothetical protein